MTFLKSSYKHVILNNKQLQPNVYSIDFPDEDEINQLIDNPSGDVGYTIEWIIEHHPHILEIDELSNEWCLKINNVICHTGFKADKYSCFMSIINNSTHIIALKLV